MQHTLEWFTKADLTAARKSTYQVMYSRAEIDHEINHRQAKLDQALIEIKITNQH